MKRTVTFEEYAILWPGETPDVSFVPPMVRRRFSPLQKIYFALAGKVEKTSAGNAVFSTRDGEETLTRRLVDEFHEDGTVSPHRFSSSVYNAAPGLWSVFTGNTGSYTAVASGDDSVECGLIEALSSETSCLYVYAEETGGGYGASIFTSVGGSGRRVEVTGGSSASESITFGRLARFLTGETHVLEGRWITLRDVPCAV